MRRRGPGVQVSRGSRPGSTVDGHPRWSLSAAGRGPSRGSDRPDDTSRPAIAHSASQLMASVSGAGPGSQRYRGLTSLSTKLVAALPINRGARNKASTHRVADPSERLAGAHDHLGDRSPASVPRSAAERPPRGGPSNRGMPGVSRARPGTRRTSFVAINRRWATRCRSRLSS